MFPENEDLLYPALSAFPLTELFSVSSAIEMSRLALLLLRKFYLAVLDILKRLIIVYDVSRGPTIPDMFCLYKNAGVLFSVFVMEKMPLCICL